MNGTSKSPTNGVVDLGTVLTAHQSLDNYATKTWVSDSYVPLSMLGDAAAYGVTQTVTDADNVLPSSAAVKSFVEGKGYTTNKGTVTSVVVKMNGTTKGTIPSSGTIDLGAIVTYTSNANIDVVGNTKTVAKVNPETLYVPNGLIMGGTAAAAGLVTRGICGVGTPDSTGACTKENLYINYDSDNTYRSGRQVVLQAGSVGTHYGNNLYQYAAARGDAVKG